MGECLKRDYRVPEYERPSHLELRKDELLADGRRYLKTVGKKLAAQGFIPQTLTTCTGGPAVAGEVILKAWSESCACGMEIWVCHLTLDCDRDDGVQILARTLTHRVERHRLGGRSTKSTAPAFSYTIGPNVWLSANLDADALAERLCRMVGVRVDNAMPRQPALPEP